ncbi:hypothetical protein LZC95_14315 [Pendulispora brunnea]|uniref:Uncharacterized protein n=1 Tax=Pendulispora brunnea TaxID=2905690 RepID=A0ABZ2KK67_9BACT
MKTFFIVRVLDVNYAAFAAKNAAISVDGGAARPMTPTRQPGVFEIELPEGTSTLEVNVEHPGFWPARQRLRVQQGPLPVLNWDGPQEINSRNLEAHTRGADANVVLNIVLGQLKDARAQVEQVFPADHLSPERGHIRDLDASILNPRGTGWGRLRHTVRNQQLADGKLFFAHRATVPKLIAIYRPPRMFVQFQRDGKDPFGNSIPYHIFFHPSTSKFTGAYPFSAQYIDLVARYVLYRQVHNVGKAMANQHFVSGKRCVFVFPVGSASESFGSLPNQTELLRLLQEVNYWLQRMDGISFPINPVGHCAVSGFSAGCAAVRHVLESSYGPFDRQHLREVYGLDLFQHGGIQELAGTLRHWFRNGADGRKLRIYTQSRDWFVNLRALLPNPGITSGPSNAVEEDTASSTLLYCPADRFWADMVKEVVVRPELGDFDNVPPAYDQVHQMVPTLFMSHALKLSTFTD